MTPEKLEGIERPFRVGVLSDTHVPDRVGDLHPDIVPSFKKFGVDMILHTGDVSSYSIIECLQKIAPVQFVHGNRDWFNRKEAELVRYVSAAGIKIALTHGHGGWVSYIIDKFPYMLAGYHFERYFRHLVKIKQDAQIVVFGHTHYTENRKEGDCLYFNSGSAYDKGNDGLGPTIGLLEIFKSGEIKGTIIPLRKAIWRNNQWQFLHE
ncbi:MAG: hypothetical protein CVU39_19735 [Chloroflexi bacterium HGW-Chloroflexi-10]|nr:MAG: hypothetical protein CVU39_19735 [Chloroflexi bacterium HGW-Chloroflexi-10]